MATPSLPLTAVVAPSSVPLPDARAAVTVAPAMGLPLPSSTRTTGWEAAAKTSPSSAVAGGWVTMMISGSGGGPSSAVALKVTGDPSRSATVAVVPCVPAAGPRVRLMPASPSSPVWTVASDTLPPP